MIHAISATCDAFAANTPFRALTAARPLPRPSAALELREDHDPYIPDFLSELENGPDPSLSQAAIAETKPSIKAMALIDEACNLVSVLAGSLEPHDDDAQTQQSLTVLRIVQKKLDKAHERIDGQEARHRTLFMAYATLKTRSGEDPTDLD